MAPPTKKRKKSAVAVEEITFDPNAREDYLTGFHKRKVQRIKHAQEEAAKKERQERIVERKRVNQGSASIPQHDPDLEYYRCEKSAKQSLRSMLRQ